MNRELNPQMKHLRFQALLGWHKEARNLTWFGLQDGMQILEIGSGPGFITRQLLELCPNSKVTALEVKPAMLELARQNLTPEQLMRTQFIQASVMDTCLPESSFDFALARMVFLHLPDPLGASRQVYRLLRPGGKLVVVDIDDGVYGILDPLITEFPAIMEKLAQAQASRGGDRYIGRRLWRILRAAGFVNLDLEVVAQHSDASGLEAFRPLLDLQRLESLRKSGLLDEGQVAKLQTAAESFWASPDAYVMMLFLMICGERSDESL
jgi:ubiquinone/menaquinone biosynthesis C-methylase UbiE